MDQGARWAACRATGDPVCLQMWTRCRFLARSREWVAVFTDACRTKKALLVATKGSLMPTGALHARVMSDGEYVKCRCTIGQEHDENGWYEDDDEDGGTKYCCGAIYEDGEDTCASCGEPL